MSIKQQTIRGAVWISISNAARQLVFLLLSTILYRLLPQPAFGTIAMATVLIAAMGLFQNMGIGAALIQRKDQVDLAASTAFFLYPALGVVLAAVGWFAAPLMAEFFNDPVLRPAVRIMTLTFIPTSFARVFMVMMDKLFEYYRRMWVELAAVAAFGMVALTLALRGWGVWSLIWGYVAQELVVAAGCAALCSFRPRLAFDRRIAGQLFSFGKHVLGSGAINFLIYQGDRALISRLLGKAPLGYYAESYKWGSQPIFQASSILARVTYPAFTRLQDKPDGLRDAFMRIYFFISWLALPFFVGIWFLAPELATVIFGRRWDPAVMVPLLRVVAFYGMARAMLSPAGALFQAVGRPHYLSRITVVRLAIIVVAIYPVTRIWGLLGTAWVVTGSLLAVAPVFYLLAGRILQRSVFQILLHLRAALLSSTVMGAVLWALARMTAIDGHWGLLARVLAGAAVYAAVLWVVSPASRGQLRDMVGTFFE